VGRQRFTLPQALVRQIIFLPSRDDNRGSALLLTEELGARSLLAAPLFLIRSTLGHERRFCAGRPDRLRPQIHRRRFSRCKDATLDGGRHPPQFAILTVARNEQ